MELRIRPFRATDFDRLYFLEQRCHAPAFRMAYQHLLATLLDEHAAALVAEVEQPEGPPLAAALVVRAAQGAATLEIVTLMVDEAFRRLGIARRMMEWALRLAEAQGRHEVSVALEAGNGAGAAFLRATGFAPSDRPNACFPDPAQGALWLRTLPEPPAETDEESP
ncbi:MAG: GNAT family N-acetyltransferase [Candidatus Lambdaproteobacteria bacterium]|nr:GNAT family N-acetyltransferase [Candidatus Lambdaproteobacteria bacterium]